MLRGFCALAVVMAPRVPKLPINPELMRRAEAVLRRSDWRSLFSVNAARRGEQLCESGNVTLDKVATGSLADGVLIKATVRSQTDRYERYKVAIEMAAAQAQLILDCECTCPVGLQCKHAAAVVHELLAQNDADELDIGAPEVRPDHAGQLEARQALISDLERKAAELGFNIAELFPGARDGAPRAATAVPESVHQPTVDPQDAKNLRAWKDWLQRLTAQPAMLDKLPYELDLRLTIDGQRLLVQVLGRKPRASGRPELFKQLPNFFDGRLHDPWAEIAPADQPLFRLLLVNPIARQYSLDRALVGTQGLQALTLLIDRGCKFAGTALATPRLAGPRQAGASWSLMADGSQKLAVALQPPAEIVDIDGLWYVDLQTGELGPVEGIDARQLEQIRRAPVLRPALREVLAPRLAVVPSLPAPIHMETRLRSRLTGARLEVCRAPTIYSHAAAPISFGARLGFHYDDVLIDAEDRSGTSTLIHGQVRTVVERHRASEQAWVDKLREFGMARFYEHHHSFVPLWISRTQPGTAEGWLELGEPLRALGFEVVYAADFPLELAPDPDTWFADLAEHEGSPWFDLELGIRIGDEKVSLLPILVKALATRSLSMTPLPNERPDATWLAPRDDKQRVRLPLAKVRALMAPILEWLDQLGRGNSLKLPLLRADLASAYGELDVNVRAANTLSRLAQVLKAGLEGVRIEPPAALKGTLRDYQLDGLVWLDFLARHQLGGLLADDMGLGKTIQVLAHLLSEKAQGRLQAPVLIVMPTSLVPNWQSEAARFAPTLKLLTLHGGGRKAHFARGAEFDVILTTYALLPRDFDALAALRFDLVVFDEAQALKNPLAKAALCARRLNAQRRLVMTGTPVENHLGELWAQVDLVLPGLLGGRREFATHFRTPIERHQDVERRERLTRRLRPFLLRRSKQQVARELPPKTEIVQRIELEGPQREFYESLRLAMHERVREAIKARGVAQSSIVVLDALLKLRQVCCDPALVKLPAASKQRSSAKREALFDLLEPLLAEGRRVLLFSQFTEMLDLIQGELDQRKQRYVRLDGSTRDRAAPVQAFQAGEVPLLLISLKAGGVGLNLTAADTVIHYDPWWNPAVESQATDRAHRIGQDKPVFVYKLVCSDTVEDKIIALQTRKAELASAILDGGASTSLRFDEATIEELLGKG